MRKTAHPGLVALLVFFVVAPVLAQEQPQGPPAINDKEYPACLKAYEERIKLSPRDANLYYRMGICIYYQVRNANELAVLANRDVIVFVTECNRTLACDENKARIKELQTREGELKKNFEDLRDNAIEAFATAVAIGGGGPEVGAAQTELEKLYRTKGSPDRTNPLEGLDDLIAQKKKEIEGR